MSIDQPDKPPAAPLLFDVLHNEEMTHIRLRAPVGTPISVYDGEGPSITMPAATVDHLIGILERFLAKRGRPRKVESFRVGAWFFDIQESGCPTSEGFSLEYGRDAGGQLRFELRLGDDVPHKTRQLGLLMGALELAGLNVPPEAAQADPREAKIAYSKNLLTILAAAGVWRGLSLADILEGEPAEAPATAPTDAWGSYWRAREPGKA